MTPVDLNIILSRIERAFQVVKKAAGDGYETSYQAEGSNFITTFRAVGVKSLGQLEDDFLNLFVWTWSLKDYIKKSFEVIGLPAHKVEEIANQSRALTYVADIANRAKHGVLKESRSGLYAELVNVGFEAPQDAIANISFADPEVTLHLNDPQLVRIHASVRVNSGETFDALAVLGEAMDAWEIGALTHLA